MRRRKGEQTSRRKAEQKSSSINEIKSKSLIAFDAMNSSRALHNDRSASSVHMCDGSCKLAMPHTYLITFSNCYITFLYHKSFVAEHKTNRDKQNRMSYATLGYNFAVLTLIYDQTERGRERGEEKSKGAATFRLPTGPPLVRSRGYACN